MLYVPFNCQFEPIKFSALEVVTCTVFFIAIVPPKETLLACACFNCAARVDFNSTCSRYFSGVCSLKNGLHRIYIFSVAVQFFAFVLSVVTEVL